MTLRRREMLQALGLSTGSLAWALGCGAARPDTRRVAGDNRGEIRAWLRDGVERLAAVFSSVQAHATMHHRTTAAIDVLGTGVARARRDAVVFTVRDAAGAQREHVTNDLSRTGIRAAVTVLAGSREQRARLTFPPPSTALGLVRIDDAALVDRVAMIVRADKVSSSRIVYAAASIDIDDVTTWSIAPDHDREQRVRRIRTQVTRAAWNGTRPAISQLERGWMGELGDQTLSDDEVSAVSAKALLQMTPGTFDDGERTLVLDPHVAATLLDIAVRGLLTSLAARRPEVARRIVVGEGIASPLLSLADDPTVRGAYGGFAFDDAGRPAGPVMLLEGGRVAGRLARRPSHLVMVPGTSSIPQLQGEGWLLEGRVTAAYDPSSDRLVLTVARARELRNGSDTGRVFPNVELSGELASLLGRIDGVGAQNQTMVVRDERDTTTLWRSIAAPHVRTRGLVRGRRLA
ncbi:MAG: metallopeptidase TldD-related protein [Kofleriaceae bacterium]|nr:metallopeptidase TldD-related protein [Kofleriaceae bacterium]